MANYMPPWLDQPSYARPEAQDPTFRPDPHHRRSALVVGFFVALITAIVMAGGGG
jgi:hypothetical protein